MRWTYVFESHGGYDCTSAAYEVRRGGSLVLVIDVADFADRPDWDLRHEPNAEAEALARAICQRMDGL